jgi:hypothetical protein
MRSPISLTVARRVTLLIIDSQLEWATACTRRHICVRPARFLRNRREQWISATKLGNLPAGTLGAPSHEIRDPIAIRDPHVKIQPRLK